MPGSESALSVAPNSVVAPAASEPPVHLAAPSSTVPSQPSVGWACSISMPAGAVSVKDVIGSERSFGASNEIDPELLLARKLGVATTCAAAGATNRSEIAIALQAEMASDDHPLHLIRAL